MSRDSSEIRRLAENAFRNALPASWVVIEENPDERHIDYKVEIKEGGKPSGLDFSVQLKGVTTAKGGQAHLSYPFKRDHIEYWVDKHRRPLFVAIADLKAGQCYFCDIHHWNEKTGPRWRSNRRKITVRMPKINRVADTARFLEAVRAADIRIRERWPGSVHAAAAQDTARLKALDDRFDYEYHHRDGETTISLHAKTPVSFRIQAACSSRSALPDAARG